MTRQEWHAICSDLNGTFATGFPPDRANVFWKRFAERMTVGQFNAVMNPIVERNNFAPTPAEFIAERDRALAPLPWVDVWPICEQAAHHCGRANANETVLKWAEDHGVDTSTCVARDIGTEEPGNTPAADIATAVVRIHAGPLAAAWFAAHGRSAILHPSASFGDETYGTAAIRKLGDAYAEYVAAQPTRQAHAAALGAPTTTLLNQ